MSAAMSARLAEVRRGRVCKRWQAPCACGRALTMVGSVSTNGNQSFWTTLPGILTGLAAVLTAVGGIVTVVLTRDDNKSDGGGTTLTEWSRQANQICEDGYADIRALNVPSDPQSQFLAIPQTSRISNRSNARLQALDRPAKGKEDIDRLLTLASQAHVAAKNAYDSYRTGDRASAQRFLDDAQRKTLQVQDLDAQLGANVCAQGP